MNGKTFGSGPQCGSLAIENTWRRFDGWIRLPRNGDGNPFLGCGREATTLRACIDTRVPPQMDTMTDNVHMFGGVAVRAAGVFLDAPFAAPSRKFLARELARIEERPARGRLQRIILTICLTSQSTRIEGSRCRHNPCARRTSIPRYQQCVGSGRICFAPPFHGKGHDVRFCSSHIPQVSAPGRYGGRQVHILPNHYICIDVCLSVPVVAFKLSNLSRLS
jgi:hypothetical protein